MRGSDRVKIARLACVAGCLLFASACVTSGTYDELAAQQEATAQERDALKEYTGALEARMETLQREHDALLAELAVREAEVAELKGTYDELVSELETWLTDNPPPG